MIQSTVASVFSRESHWRYQFFCDEVCVLPAVGGYRRLVVPLALRRCPVLSHPGLRRAIMRAAITQDIIPLAFGMFFHSGSLSGKQFVTQRQINLLTGNCSSFDPKS
jgi:hypothetical protein